jgi:hypothetical protein
VDFDCPAGGGNLGQIAHVYISVDITPETRAGLARNGEVHLGCRGFERGKRLVSRPEPLRIPWSGSGWYVIVMDKE